MPGFLQNMQIGTHYTDQNRCRNIQGCVFIGETKNNHTSVAIGTTLVGNYHHMQSRVWKVKNQITKSVSFTYIHLFIQRPLIKGNFSCVENFLNSLPHFYPYLYPTGVGWYALAMIWYIIIYCHMSWRDDIFDTIRYGMENGIL